MTDWPQEMLLVDLIKNYRPVYPDPGDWETTVRYLYENEATHMAELTASLFKEGWREPITLSELDPDDPEYTLCVEDGTHRVAIALHEGLISVPVIPRSQWVELTKPALILKIISPRELTEEENDELLNRFRSWALDERNWITSSVSFGSGNNTWEMYLDFEDETRCGALARRARKLIKELHPNEKFTVSVAPDEDEED